MPEPIVFVIDCGPLTNEDMLRTQHKVLEVVQELREDGVQVRSTGMAIGVKRKAVLQPFDLP